MAERGDEASEQSEVAVLMAESDGEVFRLRAEAVDWRVVEEQVVALDRARSVYLAVNQAGAALWPAIVAGTTRDGLVRVLLDTFDVDADRAGADVDTFVAGLDERDLLER